MGRIVRTLVSSSLAASLVLAPLTAGAQDPAAEQARALFDEGNAAYRSGDFGKASELYESALGRAASISDPGQRSSTQRELQFNIARVETRAYEKDRSTLHLDKAKRMLEQYLATGPDSEAERLLVWVNDQLEGAGASSGPDPRKGPEPAMVAGAFFIGLGVAGGVGAGVAGATIASSAQDQWEEGPSMKEREDALSRGRTGNILIIAGSIGGAVLTVTGLALVGVGARKKREREARVVVAPSLAPGHAGVALSGRF